MRLTPCRHLKKMQKKLRDEELRILRGEQEVSNRSLLCVRNCPSPYAHCHHVSTNASFAAEEPVAAGISCAERALIDLVGPQTNACGHR